MFLADDGMWHIADRSPTLLEVSNLFYDVEVSSCVIIFIHHHHDHVSEPFPLMNVMLILIVFYCQDGNENMTND